VPHLPTDQPDTCEDPYGYLGPDADRTVAGANHCAFRREDNAQRRLLDVSAEPLSKRLDLLSDLIELRTSPLGLTLPAFEERQPVDLVDQFVRTSL